MIYERICERAFELVNPELIVHMRAGLVDNVTKDATKAGMMFIGYVKNKFCSVHVYEPDTQSGFVQCVVLYGIKSPYARFTAESADQFERFFEYVTK